ncbi:hypothetical protein CTA2_9537, partial [Colletotrichum tanaceti]
MEFNAQAAQATPPSGPQDSFANNPAPQDHVAPAISAANDVVRNASPSSVSSAGDAAGRKMKRTGAAKQIVKRSPYGQAPPPWVTSLLGGRASLGPMTRTPSSTQGPTAPQPNITTDTPGNALSIDSSISQSGSESSSPLVSGGPLASGGPSAPGGPSVSGGPLASSNLSVSGSPPAPGGPSASGGPLASSNLS